MNIISSVNNFIINKPVDSSFFKGIVMLPVVGLVVQIWKRTLLLNEIKAIDPANDPLYTRIVKKMEVKNLGQQSYKFGSVADTAVVIYGLASIFMASSTPFVATSILATGALSLLARKFMALYF